MRSVYGYGSVVAAVASLGLFVAACGDSIGESHVQGGGTSNGGASSQGASANNGGSIVLAGNTNGASSSAGSDGMGGSENVGGGCAASTAQAELAPVYLVFLLDESGSMGDGENGDRTKKWDPVTAALKAFFADPASTGITASLSIFPLNQNKTNGAADNDFAPACNAAAYVDPIVAPTALPNDKAFADAIMTLDPPNEYGTPTFPGLSGTIQYAESVLAEEAERKVAIVMVTDGQPFGCGNQGNNIDNTAMAAADVSDRIPTYVIGVADESNSLDSLDAIAEGGGTDKAFIVEVDNPEQTRTELLDAINLIRGQAISCELPIPAPPAGKRLDPDKVDVRFTPEGQASTPLKYGTECTGDTAWRYDDPMKPKQVILCDATCNTVKADPKGKLDVVFGCVDRMVVQ
jgi:Mg-chelatase subunit ChlD